MTKISEKGIEKAARALCAAEGHKDPDALICPAFDHDNPRPRWTFYVNDARAAIAAYLDVVEGDLSRHEPSDAAWKAAKLAYETTAGPAKLAEAIRAAYEVDGVTPVSDPELTKYRDAAASELVATEVPASDPAPVGWRMVPVEPTEAQIELLAKAYDWVSFDPEEDGLLDVAQPVRDRARYDARLLYPLLLATSPEPPVSDGWRDIASAPERERGKRNDVLLGSFPKGIIAVGEAYRPPRDQFTMMDGTYYAPTHWQPLPAAPKGKGSE